MTAVTPTTDARRAEHAGAPDPHGAGVAPAGATFTTDRGIWVDTRGDRGPAVLLIAGLGDPAEAWAFQLDELATAHRVVAFDNRGAGRSALPSGPLTVASMADDAREVMDAVGFETAHVVGFSGGSVIAQELALRHADRVATMTLVGTWAAGDALFRAMADAWRWMATHAPSARAFYEAFFCWVYTPAAHASGFVAAVVEEALAFPHPQPVEAFLRQLDAFVAHDARDRLPTLAVPTLVVAGGLDLICPPRLGRVVADAIPGARFELLPDAAHQPFQEAPDEFHALLRGFWQDVAATTEP